jgi:2'-5' RNA ligase
MQRTVRTFVAVEISSEVRSHARQLIAELSETPAKVRWVEPENLHLTLKFLGDVELVDMPAVCDAVSAAVADLPPFDLMARGAGAFPTLDRPRTVWIGFDEGTDDIVALHGAIEMRLAPLGFRREQRRFRPHLTIGRVRDCPPEAFADLAQRLSAAAEFVGGSTDVNEVVVFSSELRREGPTYEPLGHAELGGI